MKLFSKIPFTFSVWFKLSLADTVMTCPKENPHCALQNQNPNWPIIPGQISMIRRRLFARQFVTTGTKVNATSNSKIPKGSEDVVRDCQVGRQISWYALIGVLVLACFSLALILREYVLLGRIEKKYVSAIYSELSSSIMVMDLLALTAALAVFVPCSKDSYPGQLQVGDPFKLDLAPGTNYGNVNIVFAVLMILATLTGCYAVYLMQLEGKSLRDRTRSWCLINAFIYIILIAVTCVKLRFDNDLVALIKSFSNVPTTSPLL
jgi:hypothetical protein